VDTAAIIHQMRVTLWELSYASWKTEVLFSPRWWVLVVLIASAYLLWWLLVDKRRLSQILLFGSFIAVGRIVMDLVGNNLVLWSYDIREVPFVPSPFLHDFTITPIILMLVYQYNHSWKRFLAWTALAVGGITFAFFPALIAFGYLKYYHWNHAYSFVLIIFIVCLSRAALIGLLQLEQEYQRVYSLVSPATTLVPKPAMKPLDQGKDEENQ
jgi:hypothetical protein